MSISNYEELREHIGHKVVVACYGREGKEPQNIAIECEDCNEVLLSFDKGESINSLIAEGSI